MARKPERKSWQDSWAVLEQHGVTLPGEEGWTPDSGDRPHAEEPDFRGLVVRDRVFEEVDFEDLCLVRTLFSGCRFNGVSFRNTDLSLCCLQGCEWIDCDFSEAVLI